VIYLIAGIGGGHFRRSLLPRGGEWSPRLLWRDLLAHLRGVIPPAHGGPPYGLLQKYSYSVIVFVALPVMVLSGLTMSPTVVAAWPVLLDLFGGSQSARTIHFFVFALVVLFLFAHVAMVLLSGFGRQLRAMTLGGPR
jgi:thiosulfate reductase cytochrome b subunit